ncbi:MAG TPA: choice-of-anchor D domain-containing protein [Bryobacteraceae bacterium]|nr:choice-of-anchor D domain-containing protein [Bryobacteraceae bacterium]
MRTLLLLALCCYGLSAQTLTFAITDNTGATPDVPLPSAYQFPTTQQGSASSILIKITNSSQSTVEVVLPYVGNSAGSPQVDPNFSVSDESEDHILAPGAFEVFTLNFTPSGTGQLFGYLQVDYLTQVSGCTLNSTSSATQCPVTIAPVSTLEGTATPASLLLTYNNAGVNTALLPNAGTARLDFRSVSKGATSALTFTLANQTASPLTTPAISIQGSADASTSTVAFALNTANLPALLPANGSGTFIVTFAPGQTGLTTATLLVGTNSYDIQGTGTAASASDSLAISYVTATKVQVLPQAAQPIDFGQIVPGTGGSATLTFTVANTDPNTFGPVTLSTLAVTGAAYSLGGAPSLPATIQPNASITFTVTFNASASGTYTGTLTVGDIVFSLTGLSVVSSVPAITMQVSEQPLTSAQQVNLTIQASSAATQQAIGTLTMKFTPSVTGVTDDPAIVFLATNGRQLQVNLAADATAATYNSQSTIGFQTGTTAGTITFTLTFANAAPITQSYTITPALIHLTSSTATRESPNLAIILDGYDNTYTAGKLSFVFYDTSGNQINSTAMAVDATSNFHQYFYTNNAAGGSFSMQASFPVTGDVTKVGSVAVTLTNSVGQTSTKLTFQ